MGFLLIDINEDFVRNFPLTVTEILTEEQTGEGLEPEDYDFVVGLTQHADDRMEEYGLDDYNIHVLLEKMGNGLLNITNNETFTVIDAVRGVGIVCVLYQQGLTSVIKVITMLRNSNIYVTRGTKTFTVENFLQN